VGLVGESGCGKTTLARIMMGLQKPTSGEVLVSGQPIASYGRRDLARRIQPIFQDPYSSLNPRWRVGDILALPLQLHGIGNAQERHDRVIEIMGQCGLDRRFLEAFPAQLSGGQRQRVATARALIVQPELIICDEPTSALDVSVQAQILNLLQELRERFKLTYLFISHNLAVVEHIATRVCVMYLGRFVEEAPKEALFSAPRHPYTAMLLDAVLTHDPSLGLPSIELGANFPNPAAPPSGCGFHPRCTRALPQCSELAPQPTRAGPGRVECHLYTPAGTAAAPHHHDIAFEQAAGP
jgi:peptide/nickel transport system ATP-binding protein